MKKVILSAVLLSGVMVSAVAYADDQKNAETTINSEVTAGTDELSFESSNIDFGKQALSPDVKFAPQTITYTVTDNTGAPAGYSISAKVKDEDEKRMLMVNDVTLSTNEAVVYTTKTSENGMNTGAFVANLEYRGLSQLKKYTAAIEWNVSPRARQDIAE